MDTTKLLKVGTKVKFGENNKMKGQVSAILVREFTISYEVSYWKSDELKAAWLYPSQFTVTKKQYEGIGFLTEQGRVSVSYGGVVVRYGAVRFGFKFEFLPISSYSA